MGNVPTGVKCSRKNTECIVLTTLLTITQRFVPIYHRGGWYNYEILFNT